VIAQLKLSSFLRVQYGCREFPVSLSKAQRKFAHNQAQRMGMKSKSVGKEGVNRHLTVHQEPKGDERPSSEVHIHPSSVNSRTLDFLPFLVYLEKVKTTRVFIRDCTPVSAYPIILFGGRLILKPGSAVGKPLQSSAVRHQVLDRTEDQARELPEN
jgi:hypothetical protein